MQYNAILCNTMQYHAIPCNIMQYHAIPCNTMQYRAIPCNTMQCHAIPCSTMQYHVIPCNTKQYHAILYQWVWVNSVGQDWCGPFDFGGQIMDSHFLSTTLQTFIFVTISSQSVSAGFKFYVYLPEWERRRRPAPQLIFVINAAKGFLVCWNHFKISQGKVPKCNSYFCELYQLWNSLGLLHHWSPFDSQLLSPNPNQTEPSIRVWYHNYTLVLVPFYLCTFLPF